MTSLTIFLPRQTDLKTAKNSLIILTAFLVLTGCATQQAEPIAPPPPQIEPTLSSLALTGLTEVDYKFAQAALEQLGYPVLYIDGIWGPKSEAAIQLFEQDNALVSASGGLSELNLTRLDEATTISRTDFEVVAPSSTPIQALTPVTSIAAKLDADVALSSSPQLIITDLNYNILAKPNPYSETVTQLPLGAGLYIIGQQEGWYEVETLERQRGYIKE